MHLFFCLFVCLFVPYAIYTTARNGSKRSVPTDEALRHVHTGLAATTCPVAKDCYAILGHLVHGHCGSRVILLHFSPIVCDTYIVKCVLQTCMKE